MPASSAPVPYISGILSGFTQCWLCVATWPCVASDSAGCAIQLALACCREDSLKEALTCCMGTH